MSTPEVEKDERPWDLRLVEWMSRDSSSTRSNKRLGPVGTAGYAMVYWLVAVVKDETLWFVGAIALTILSVVRFARARSQN